MKGCICHFGKWQIHSFISKGTNSQYFSLTNYMSLWKTKISLYCMAVQHYRSILKSAPMIYSRQTIQCYMKTAIWYNHISKAHCRALSEFYVSRLPPPSKKHGEKAEWRSLHKARLLILNSLEHCSSCLHIYIYMYSWFWLFIVTILWPFHTKILYNRYHTKIPYL